MLTEVERSAIAGLKAEMERSAIAGLKKEANYKTSLHKREAGKKGGGKR